MKYHFTYCSMQKHFLIVLSAFFLTACINEPEEIPNTREGNFEALWKIIDTKYCYLDYKNINWDSIHNVYKQRLNNDTTTFGFFDLMGEMLGELKDGHVNLYSEFDRSYYAKWYTDYPRNFSSQLIYSSRYLGDNYRSVGGIHYGKINDGSIGYMYYGSFSNAFSDANIKNIFQYFQDCTALIIDVRNNGGGSIDYSKKLASYFFQKETITGYIRHKIGSGHSAFSQPQAIITPSHSTIQWTKPVTVLTNRLSYSATNDFVNRMKMAPKALIVGDRTGGGGGFPLSSELPNGWMVRFSSSPMFDADMQHTEWGIMPNYVDSITGSDQARGYDSIIERAIMIMQ
jgi:hypothetical protein